MQYLTDKQKADKLIHLISKDRSRDNTTFLNLGRTLCMIFDGTDDGLILWKKASIQETYEECDRYWIIIKNDSVLKKKYSSIRDFLLHFDNINITDINSVKSILNKIGETSDNARKIIERICPNKYFDINQLLDTNINIIGLLPYKIAYNIHTLERWARIDNEEEYKKLLISESYIDNSIYDIKFGTNVWYDVCRDISLKKYNIEGGVHHLLCILRSCLAYIGKGTGIFVTNDKNGLSICSRSSILSYCNDFILSSINNKITLKTVICDYWAYISYADISYHPGITPINELNLFKSYAAEITDKIDDHSINIITYHIKHILCNNNNELYQYLVNWMSFVVQKSDKPKVAILMIGKQGIGKTIFWEWFINEIIGMNNSFIVPTLSDITGKFNSHIANKRAILVNEVKGTSKHDHDTLKTLISDNYIKVEKKGVDAIQIGSSHCLICTSNHRDYHFINDEDRRFCVFDCNTQKMDISYFNKLYDALSLCCNMFYTWLMNRDIHTYRPDQYPNTTIKQEIINNNNTNSVQLFLQDYICNDWTKASDVYTDYINWCKRCNLTGKDIVPLNRFKTHSGEIIDVRKINSCTQYRKR